MLPNYMYIDEGFNPNTITLLGNEHVFEKTRRRTPLLRKIDTNLQDLFFLDIPFHRHCLKFWPTGYRQHAKEARTAQLWKNAGIPTTDYLNHSKRNITYKLADGTSFSRYLLEGWDAEAFSKLLDVYHMTRDHALETGNSDYFHSDPALCNFLLSDRQALAFDSATVLNPLMSMNSLDAHLMLFFLFDLSNQSDDISDRSTKAFVDSLSGQERQRVKDLEYSTIVPLTFGRLRFAAAYAVKGSRARSPVFRFRDNLEKHERIRDYL